MEKSYVGSILFDERPLLVMPKLAVLLGLKAATFLQQVNYWICRSEHIIDGRRWIFNSLEDWHKQFPFFSIRTISRIISDLENKKVLLSGNFNQKGFDRTKWYSIDYERLNTMFYEMLQNSENNDKKTSGEAMLPTCPNGGNIRVTEGSEDVSEKAEGTLVSCGSLAQDKALSPEVLSPSGEAMLPTCPNASSQLDQMHLDKLARPIPYTTTYTTTENTPNTNNIITPLEEKNINKTHLTPLRNNNIYINNSDEEENRDIYPLVTRAAELGILRDDILFFIEKYGVNAVREKLFLLSSEAERYEISHPEKWLFQALKKNFLAIKEKPGETDKKNWEKIIQESLAQSASPIRAISPDSPFYKSFLRYCGGGTRDAPS